MPTPLRSFNLGLDDGPKSKSPIDLTPATAASQGGAVPDLVTRGQTLDALKQELDAWHARGGMLSKNSADPKLKAQGGIPMPGGMYGGEFSDEEMNAYHDAAQKYASLLGQHLAELRTNKLANAAGAKATTPADATSVLVRALQKR